MADRIGISGLVPAPPVSTEGQGPHQFGPIIRFVALAFVSIAGPFFVSFAGYTPWNASGEGPISAIGAAAAKVRNPDRNVPRATVLGTIATAVVYTLSLTVVFGIVPTPRLASATAPFSDAVDTMFGGTWAGNVWAADG